MALLFSPVFVQFLPETSPADIRREINLFMEKYYGSNSNGNGTEAIEKYSSLGFTPLSDIHFDNSGRGGDIHFSKASNIQYSYILGAIALLTLFIALYQLRVAFVDQFLLTYQGSRCPEGIGSNETFCTLAVSGRGLCAGFDFDGACPCADRSFSQPLMILPEKASAFSVRKS
jgi:hypothetical protein